MGKRTPENCKYIKHCGEPGRDGAGKCLGFAKSEIDDEPAEPCKKCVHNSAYDDDFDFLILDGQYKESVEMGEDWYDDKCCATCTSGELVQGEDGEVVYCRPIEEYVATDYYCPGYENQGGYDAENRNNFERWYEETILNSVKNAYVENEVYLIGHFLDTESIKEESTALRHALYNIIQLFCKKEECRYYPLYLRHKESPLKPYCTFAVCVRDGHIKLATDALGREEAVVKGNVLLKDSNPEAYVFLLESLNVMEKQLLDLGNIQ